jgi:hypothetical protein
LRARESELRDTREMRRDTEAERVSPEREMQTERREE